MVWFIVGVVVLIVFCFAWMFVRGADLRDCNSYARMVEDEQQKKALARINRKKK